MNIYVFWMKTNYFCIFIVTITNNHKCCDWECGNSQQDRIKCSVLPQEKKAINSCWITVSRMCVFTRADTDPPQPLFSLLWNIKFTPWSHPIYGSGTMKGHSGPSDRAEIDCPPKKNDNIVIFWILFGTLSPESKHNMFKPCLLLQARLAFIGSKERNRVTLLQSNKVGRE